MKFSKHIINSLIFGSMLTMGLTFSSCNDDLRDEPVADQETPAEDDGMVDVTFSLSLDDLKGMSRAVGDEETDGTITDLRDIDLLIYALRDENDKVLYQYGKGVDPRFKDSEGKIDRVKFPAFKHYEEDIDNNQTLMFVGNDEENDKDDNIQISENSWKVSFTLRVMRGTIFKLSVWAQSSKCEAYDFNYLTAVKVFYEDVKTGDLFNNNDVTRDAFCATSKFSIGQVDSDIQMTLTRPFACINVGVLNTAVNQEASNAYPYSQIKLDGVATYFNVIENKAWSQSDYEAYRAGKIGANYNPRIFNDGDPEDALNDYDREPNFTSDVTFKYSDNTENGLLIVRDHSNWTDTTKPEKIVYKSLSMCYVLVPETNLKTDDEGNILEPDPVSLKLVDLSLSTDEHGTGDVISYTEKPDLVVKRNWRTNLLFDEWEKINSSKEEEIKGE